MGTPTNRARHWFGLLAAILFKSSSAIWGASWREINNGLPTAVAGASGLGIDPTPPSTLYSSGTFTLPGDALLRTIDGGLS
jgi:hypothetical protein